LIYTIYNSAAISYTKRSRGVFDMKFLRLIPDYEKSIKICGENPEKFCGEFGCKKQPQI